MLIVSPSFSGKKSVSEKKCIYSRGTKLFESNRHADHIEFFTEFSIQIISEFDYIFFFFQIKDSDCFCAAGIQRRPNKIVPGTRVVTNGAILDSISRYPRFNNFS